MGLHAPTKRWPGGIPASIKISKEKAWTRAASRGWYKFVRENWADGIDARDEDALAAQRRSLITAWASAEQDVRDELRAFGCRSPTNTTAACYLITHVPEPGSALHALWVKLLLMFFDYESEFHIAHNVFALSPHDGEAITLDTFKRYQALEPADFRVVQFNELGEAVFGPANGAVIMVDERSLRSGLVIAAQFGVDGTPRNAYRVRPVDLPDAWRRVGSLGKPLGEVMAHFDGDKDEHDPRIWDPYPEGMDMQLPLLDIVIHYSQDTDDPVLTERAEIEEQLNQWAPGYLEAEEEGKGLAKDYDLGKVDFVV
ncbi:uncharacterized protein DSM5745_00961 [Aspergillus mulundensis]|uniref:Uncharacterized protein n=1 Tax=Aspergillus mulundensis TaxID=1810919 RepID=A0A3D8T527_9EURO|nr:hypothetical protein DSM5745_00961 [Aspergillus mulundensis]RDW93639.1 hypothetical protein DSM5745_00961 [Aspergillus mulundensis]